MADVLESKWRRKRQLLKDKLEQARAAKNAILDVCLKRTPQFKWTQQLNEHVANGWRKQPDPDKPFCYVEYVGKSRIEVYAEALTRAYGWDKKQALYYASLVYSSPIDSLPESGMYVKPTAKRNFENYAKAIAHLTKVKLSIVEDDKRFSGFTPCKIVEGCYTRNGKEHITKVTEFPNVGNRMGRDDPSSGQPREQRGPSVSIPKAMGSTGQSVSGSSGTTTSSNTNAGVGKWWYECGEHAAQQWVSASTC